MLLPQPVLGSELLLLLLLLLKTEFFLLLLLLPLSLRRRLSLFLRKWLRPQVLLLLLSLLWL